MTFSTDDNTPQEPVKQPTTPTPATFKDDEQVSLEQFQEAARAKYGIPKNLMKAMLQQESQGGKDLTSPTGVSGPWQVTEAVAKQYGLDRNDPFHNVAAGARYLKEQYDALGDIKDENERWLGAVGRYYGGPSAVQGGIADRVSRDGVSNPVEHLERVSRNWRALGLDGKPTELPTPEPQAPPEDKTIYLPTDIQQASQASTDDIDNTVRDILKKPRAAVSPFQKDVQLAKRPRSGTVMRGVDPTRQDTRIALNAGEIFSAKDILSNIKAQTAQQFGVRPSDYDKLIELGILDQTPYDQSQIASIRNSAQYYASVAGDKKLYLPVSEAQKNILTAFKRGGFDAAMAMRGEMDRQSSAYVNSSREITPQEVQESQAAQSRIARDSAFGQNTAAEADLARGILNAAGAGDTEVANFLKNFSGNINNQIQQAPGKESLTLSERGQQALIRFLSPGTARLVLSSLAGPAAPAVMGAQGFLEKPDAPFDERMKHATTMAALPLVTGSAAPALETIQNPLLKAGAQAAMSGTAMAANTAIENPGADALDLTESFLSGAAFHAKDITRAASATGVHPKALLEHIQRSVSDPVPSAKAEFERLDPQTRTELEQSIASGDLEHPIIPRLVWMKTLDQAEREGINANAVVQALDAHDQISQRRMAMGGLPVAIDPAMQAQYTRVMELQALNNAQLMLEGMPSLGIAPTPKPTIIQRLLGGTPQPKPTEFDSTAVVPYTDSNVMALESVAPDFPVDFRNAGATLEIGMAKDLANRLVSSGDREAQSMGQILAERTQAAERQGYNKVGLFNVEGQDAGYTAAHERLHTRQEKLVEQKVRETAKQEADRTLSDIELSERIARTSGEQRANAIQESMAGRVGNVRYVAKEPPKTVNIQGDNLQQDRAIYNTDVRDQTLGNLLGGGRHASELQSRFRRGMEQEGYFQDPQTQDIEQVYEPLAKLADREFLRRNNISTQEAEALVISELRALNVDSEAVRSLADHLPASQRRAFLEFLDNRGTDKYKGTANEIKATAKVKSNPPSEAPPNPAPTGRVSDEKPLPVDLAPKDGAGEAGRSAPAETGTRNEPTSQERTPTTELEAQRAPAAEPRTEPEQREPGKQEGTVTPDFELARKIREPEKPKEAFPVTDAFLKEREQLDNSKTTHTQPSLLPEGAARATTTTVDSGVRRALEHVERLHKLGRPMSASMQEFLKGAGVDVEEFQRQLRGEIKPVAEKNSQPLPTPRVESKNTTTALETQGTGTQKNVSNVGELVYNGSTANEGVLKPRGAARNYNELGSWFTSSKEAADELYSMQGEKKLEVRSYAKPEGNLLEAPHQDFSRLFGSNITLVEQYLGKEAAAVLRQKLPDSKRRAELHKELNENGDFFKVGRSVRQAEALGKELKQLDAAEKIAHRAMNNPAYIQAWQKMMQDAGYNGIVWRKSQIDSPKSTKEHDVYLVFHDKDISPISIDRRIDTTTTTTTAKVPEKLLPEINNLRSQFRAGKIKPGEVIELSNGVKVKAPSKDSQFLDIVGRKLTEEGEAYGRSAQRIRAYWANKTGEGEQAVRSILDTFNLPGDPHTGEAQDLAHRAIVKMYDNPRMAPETIGRLVQEEAKAGQKLEKTGSSLAQIPASDLYARLKAKGLENSLPPDLRQIGKEVAQGRRGHVSLYNRRPGAKDESGFYSQLERTIDQKFGKTVSLPEMERALRNSKEVKADELKWSGFDDFLVGKQMQGISKVPKEEVLRYLQANSAKLKVKEKGANAKLSPEMEERIASLKKESDELKSVIDGLAEAKEKLKKEYRKIKFLEGMEDRKIEMREKIDSVDADLFRVFAKQDDINREVRSLSKYETTKYEDYTTPGGDPDSYKEVLLTLEDPYRREESNFSSSHWDEQNVLSHARIDDRADVDGNPVRHVHEIQSDWMQAARKHGVEDFSSPQKIFQKKQLEELREKWQAGFAEDGFNLRRDVNLREHEALEERLNTLEKEYRDWNSPKVPDAPLQKTWHETTFRKLVQQAAEDGKARLTWDTGETNSMRYPGAQLNNENYKAGMHSFYDRILPEYAKKFARKWGAKVGTTEVPVRDSDPDFDSALYDRYLEVHKAEDGKITLYDGRGADPIDFPNEQSLYKHLEKKEGIAPPDKAPQKVHFIEINNAMRESVTKEGIALYNRTPKKASDKSIEHPSESLNGKKMIGRTGDGRVIVRNPENKTGVSVVKDRSFREVDTWDTSVPLYNRARLNPKEHIQARVAALYSDKNYDKISMAEKNKVKRAFAEAQTAWNKGNSKEFAEKLIQAQYYEDQIIGSKRGKVDKTLDAVTTGLRVGILTNPASRVADVTGTNLNAQMQFGINPLRRLIAHVADATLVKSAAKKVSADAGVKFNINPNEKLSKIVPKLKGKDWMSGAANGFTEGAKEFAEQLFKGYSTLQMESGMSYNVDRLQTGWKYVDKPINRVAAIFGNAPDSFARGIVFDTVSRQLARQHAEQFPESQQKAEFDKFYQDMPQEAIGLAVAMTERYTYNNPNRASELVHSVIDGFVAKPLQPGARALANSTFKFVKVPTNVAAQGMRLAAGPAMLAYDVGMLYHSLLQSYNTSTGKFDMTAAERRRSIDNLTESAVGSMLFAGLAVGTMIAKDNAYNQAIKKNVAGSYDESDTEATKMEEVREMEPGAVTIKGRTFRPGTFGPLQRTAQFQKDFLRGTGYQGLDQKTGKLKEATAGDIYAPKTGSLSKAVISQMEQFPLVGGAVETAKFLDPAKGDMAKSVANTITPGIAREIGAYTDENRRVPRKGSLWDNLKNNFGAGSDMPARINAAGEPVTKRSGASIWTKKYPESRGLDEVERLGLSLPRHNVSEKDSKYTMKEQEGKAVFLGQTIKAATDKVVTSTAYQKAKSDEEKAQMLNDVIQGINKNPDLTADEALHNAKIAVSYYSGREKLRNNATFQKLAPSQREAAENYLKAQYNKYAVTSELKQDGEKPDLMSLGADFFDFASDKAALSDLIQESVFRSAEKPKLPFERKKK